MFKDRAILLLALGQTFAWAGIYYIFPALLLRWEQDLGWSKAEITAAIALAVFVSAAVSPMTGWIIDRGHGARLMAGCAIIGGFGVAGLSLTTQLWHFYSLWGVIGAAMAGCLYEPCFAIVTRTRGVAAKHGIIVITLVAGFASTISFPVVYSLAEVAGWRGACVVFGLLVVFVVAPILGFGAGELEKTSEKARRDQPPDPIERNNVLRRPAFWTLAAGFSCVALSHGGTLHHLLPILNERGLSAEMAVLAASFIGPMQVAGRLAMMASERYLSHHGVTLFAFAVMGLSVVMLLFSGTSPAFLSGFVILFGSAYGTVSILRPLLARDILGEQNFGAKSGALAVPYLAGSAAAPFLGSVIWAWGGYNAMLLIILGFLIAGCGLYYAAHRISRAEQV